MTFQLGAAELGLQLLDHAEVGADRTVEALQVAVDDEGQVVELLAGGQGQGGGRLGLVHLAVAEEGPDVRARGVLDAPVLQVAVEARLVDRGERAEAHGDRGELPQPRQAPRVRVGRQAVAAGLLTEVVELLLGDPPVEEGAGVDAGGGVALDVELVARSVGLLPAEEVLEAGLVEPGRRGEGGDVAADAVLGAAGHHGGRVPAVPCGDLGFHLLVARELGLGGGGDGVDVVRLQQLRQGEAAWPRRAGGCGGAGIRRGAYRRPWRRRRGRPPIRRSPRCRGPGAGRARSEAFLRGRTSVCAAFRTKERW